MYFYLEPLGTDAGVCLAQCPKGAYASMVRSYIEVFRKPRPQLYLPEAYTGAPGQLYLYRFYTVPYPNPNQAV